MAELDPSIIFRQEKYSGPTQDELDAKQNMNALRNMLGAGQSIDSPEVINAMMALDPDMGLKLQSNASTMQTNAAAAQKSIADARAKDREARLAEVDRYFPVGMAIAQAGDQEGWDQFGTFLGQKFGPEALMGYPRDVKQAGTYLQRYLEAKRQYGAKNGGDTRKFGAPVVTTTGLYGIDPTTGLPTNRLVDPETKIPLMPLPKGDGGGGNEERFGMSTEGGYDEAGNFVPLARSDRGRIIAPELPKGITYAPSIKPLDVGTGFEFVGPGGRRQGAPVPKAIVEAESLKAQGAALGAMYVASKDAVQTGEHISKQIDSLLKDPQREAGTGWSSFFNVIPTSAGKSYQLKVDQLGGQAFLQAFNSLKGGGAITEQEGNKATLAIARLNTTLSEKDFEQALTDFKNVVDEITERRRKENQGAIPGMRVGQPAAGAATPAAPAAAAPTGGAVIQWSE